MKARIKPLCFLCALCVLCGESLCFSLDREAFSIPNYNLNLQLDPEQHRLGVRGRITLRNDRETPQKIAVLQISSSLGWRSIKAGDRAVQFVTQPFTSDIDHTGELSEAIVTLPQDIAPHATIDLNIAYEGVILLDATRLTRIGTPEDVARNSDWDQIDANFTAVRGAGYVAWYPIATESANLSDGNELAEVIQQWKAREARSEMNVSFESMSRSTILFSGTQTGFIVNELSPTQLKYAGFSMIRPGSNVPTFVQANYKIQDVKGVPNIAFFPGKETVAEQYAGVLGTADPLPIPGANPGLQLHVCELPFSDASPFVSSGLLLMPFRPLNQEQRLTLVYALGRHELSSPRAWITDGLAHLVQVLDLEEQQGRKVALDYLDAHSSLLVRSDEHAFPATAPSKKAQSSTSEASLINTTDEVSLQSKAMCVWWMLRDMIGDAALKKALAAYKPEQDNDPSYMPHLIAAQTQRDLQWFFNDWVYHDRGLPDFKVELAFSSKTPIKSFIVAVTVDNLGTAGAEVPVKVKFGGGEVTKRLEVRAKQKATIRIETPAAAQEVVVNDGSVPESDMGNNTFKVESPSS